METYMKLCILFGWLGQVTWLFQHINKRVTGITHIITPSQNTKNVPFQACFLCFVFWWHPPSTTHMKHAHMQCVSCVWLLICYYQPPNTKNALCFLCSAPTPSPPSAFKHRKCAKTVFDHLHPPLLGLHPPPFLALPFSFSFLDTFYLDNYHFRYFPFK